MINNIPVDRKDEIELIKDTLGYTHNPSSKNLLEITAPSKTSNGITFTVNNDGSVTANGTSTAVAVIDVNTNIYLPNGEYILSGCPKGGSADTYYIAVNGGSAAVNTSDKGDGTSFSINDYTLDRVRVWINRGQTVNNLTFYPMIRKADITDDTYEPYVNASVDVRFEEIKSLIDETSWKYYISENGGTNISLGYLDYKELKIDLIVNNNANTYRLEFRDVSRFTKTELINGGTRDIEFETDTSKYPIIKGKFQFGKQDYGYHTFKLTSASSKTSSTASWNNHTVSYVKMIVYYR
jgi:hypothetical protein